MRKPTTVVTAALGMAGLLVPAAFAGPSAQPAAAPAAAAAAPAAAAPAALAPAAAAPAAAAATATAGSPALGRAAGPAAHRRSAHAVLRLADGTRVGVAAFRRVGQRATLVTVKLRLPARITEGGTFHGFHVHANNNPANGSGCLADPAQPAATWFVSADGHYTAPGRTHGEHDGDMPVVYVLRGGVAFASFVTDRFTPAEIVGRAVIVHARPDNYANVPVGTAANQYTPNSPAATALTEATGNAGERVVCGVVRR